MKKYITLAALLAVGSTFANADVLNLDEILVGNGIRIGGDPNGAVVASGSFGLDTSYDTFQSLLKNSNTWYVQNGYNYNVGTRTTDGVPALDEAVVLVAGGPSDAGRSSCGAIRFSIDSRYFANVSEDITFSFDTWRCYGNNNKNHNVTFELLSSDWSVSASYNSKEGSSLISTNETSPTSVSFTISKEKVAEFSAEGGNVEFVFNAVTDNVNGSNTGFAMDSFKFNGVSAIPEPSAFGLLAGLGALALVGTRRRRR